MALVVTMLSIAALLLIEFEPAFDALCTMVAALSVTLMAMGVAAAVLGADRGYADETPAGAAQTQVEGFWIDRTEVTNAQVPCLSRRHPIRLLWMHSLARGGGLCRGLPGARRLARALI